MRIEEIKKLLNEKGERGFYKLDAQEIADKSGVHLNTILRIRRGDTPTYNNYIAIVRALECK